MDKVCLFLNRRKQVHAYIPQMEKYIASKETMILQVMFPGYVFVDQDMCLWKQHLINLNLMLS